MQMMSVKARHRYRKASVKRRRHAKGRAMRRKGFVKWRGRMLLGASRPVVTAGLLMASPAMAQDAPPAEDSAAANDEIVVVGVRAALQDAQDRKRDALTVEIGRAHV